MLTECQAQMQASVDQIGLAVFYLQRHRVELVIKHLLIDGLAQDPEEVIAVGHNLNRLWVRLGEVVSKISPAQWRELDEDFGAFVAVMHEADAASFTYRYPADHQGRPVARAEYIDLRALERHAERFEAGVMGYATWLEESGPGAGGDATDYVDQARGRNDPRPRARRVSTPPCRNVSASESNCDWLLPRRTTMRGRAFRNVEKADSVLLGMYRDLAASISKARRVPPPENGAWNGANANNVREIEELNLSPRLSSGRAKRCEIARRIWTLGPSEGTKDANAFAGKMRPRSRKLGRDSVAPAPLLGELFQSRSGGFVCWTSLCRGLVRVKNAGDRPATSSAPTSARSRRSARSSGRNSPAVSSIRSPEPGHGGAAAATV